MRPRLAVVVAALLLGSGVARADEPAWARSAPVGVDDEEPPAPDLPRVRLEATLSWTLLDSKVKKGPDARVAGFEPHKDAHQPLRLEPGWFAQADVVLWSWASLGGVAWSVQARGPKRHLHYEGVQLNGRSFPGGARLKTAVTLRYAELSLRYLWRSDEDLHLWFGIGPAWLSYRIALRGVGLRATGRVEAVLGPSFTYGLNARVRDWLSLFLESGFAVAPSHRFPSVVAGTRLGLRLHAGPAALVIAVHNRAGVIDEAATRFGSVRPGHRWRRARFFLVGLEVGLAFRI